MSKVDLGFCVPLTADLPAWYEISYGDRKTFIIRMPAAICDLLIKKLRSVNQQEAFPLPENKKGWGYGESLGHISAPRNGWVSIRCLLPGVEMKNAYDRLISLRKSLREIFSVLATLCPLVEVSGKSQLMILHHLLVEERSWGGWFSLVLTPAVMAWIEQKTMELEEDKGIYFPEVQKALAHTFRHLTGEGVDLCQPEGFHALVCKPNQLRLGIFTHCSLGPSNTNEIGEPKQSRRHDTHNVDAGVQQMTLLMGLAKLHDHLRKEKV